MQWLRRLLRFHQLRQVSASTRLMRKRENRNAAAEWGSTYWSEAAISVRSRSCLVLAIKKTTIIYTHELNRGVVGVKSPAGLLFS